MRDAKTGDAVLVAEVSRSKKRKAEGPLEVPLPLDAMDFKSG